MLKISYLGHYLKKIMVRIVERSVESNEILLVKLEAFMFVLCRPCQDQEKYEHISVHLKVSKLLGMVQIIDQ